MRLTGWIVLIYALIVFLGGIFGYIKAESVPSLIAGVLFAVILSTGAFALMNEKWIGMQIAIATTVLLGAFFLYRFTLSYKFMPAGLMVVLSAAMLAYLLIKRKSLKLASK